MEFRKAGQTDFEQIWEIISFAKETRKNEGSTQWQDGYPNEETIQNDIQKGYGFVFEEEGAVNLYAAIIFDKEPAYEELRNWEGQGDYLTLHRIAVSKEAKGKGLGQKILKEAEKLAKEKGIESIRIDTNFDNIPMLKIIEKEGYKYRGEVYFRGSARKAFEKILK